MDLNMANSYAISGVEISDSAPAYVIAEIGHNHAGVLEKAIQMVQTAKDNGASAVKFQTRTPSEVYSVDEFNRQTDNPQWMDPTYGIHREKLEFSPAEWKELLEACKDIGITAFSTPFDHKSADLLASLDVPAFKVASGDATNIPLIKHIASFNKPMIISTGGSSIEEVDRIHETMSATGTPFSLIQCSCIYPAPAEVLNLRVISTYRERYPDVPTGLSTHNPGIASTLAAYTLGGRIFEHHYTNDREWLGTDNNFSITPSMLRELVEGLEEIRVSLGSPEKVRWPVEDDYTIERRKKLIWTRDVEAGATIQPGDLTAKCPGDGVFPWEFDRVVGSKLLSTVTAESDVTGGQVGLSLQTETGVSK
jgi:sialic acid synthase